MNIKQYIPIIVLLDNTEQVNVGIVNSEVKEHSSSASLNPQLITQLSQNVLRCCPVGTKVLEKVGKLLTFTYFLLTNIIFKWK